jgi:hypothetical protein
MIAARTPTLLPDPESGGDPVGNIPSDRTTTHRNHTGCGGLCRGPQWHEVVNFASPHLLPEDVDPTLYRNDKVSTQDRGPVINRAFHELVVTARTRWFPQGSRLEGLGCGTDN